MPEKTSRTTIQPSFPRQSSSPLSYSQKSLWFFEHLFPLHATYNMPCLIKLRPDLNCSNIEKSINLILQRHHILTTNYFLKDGVPYQALSDKSVKINYINLSDCSLNLEEKHQKMMGLIHELAKTPFDLKNDLLMRVYFFEFDHSNNFLFTVIHHLVADGWSFGVFIRELRAIYYALQTNTPISLPPANIQYFDYIEWQESCLKENLFDEHINYWKLFLSKDAIHLNLPYDFQRPIVPKFRGLREKFAFDEKMTVAINHFSRTHRCTAFVTLMTLLKTLLYLYTQQTDITVGTPVANRGLPELETMIGLFVNTLPLRTEIDPKQSFLSLLEKEKASIHQALTHQIFPFEQIIRILQPERDLTNSPLFRIMFVLQNFKQMPDHQSGIDLTMLDITNGSTKFDLLLSLSEQKGCLTGFFEYDADLFESHTIQSMIGHFTYLASQCLSTPEKHLHDLNLLTDNEIQHKIDLASEHYTSNRISCTLHGMIEEVAKNNPSYIALTDSKESMTYKVLNIKSNQLASLMIKLGIQQNSFVAILLDYSFEMLIAIFAILKIGAAYVPMDIEYPDERIEFIINNANVSCLISHSCFVHRIAKQKIPVIVVDLEETRLNNERHTNPSLDIQPESTAYIIYTSGTTGNPKGVMISHRNVISLFLGTQPKFNFQPSDVVPLLHAYTFDFSVWEIFSALLFGGKLLIIPTQIRKSTMELYYLLANKKITILNQTPSAFYNLIPLEKENNLLTSLRFIIFGGEALNFHALKSWFSSHTAESPKLINMYGITETTIHNTYYEIKPSDSDSSASIIGHPLTDRKIYILNQDKKIVPTGIIGEMYIAGDGLSNGYLYNPDLTHERFIFHPLTNERLYKSGDLARWTHSNLLEYYGRADKQIKIRGYRIEPGEIETSINKHPLINFSFIHVYNDGSSANRIIAYIMPNFQSLRSQLQSEIQACSINQNDSWQLIFDSYYAKESKIANTSLNISGWISSFTKQNIPENEMLEWISLTSQRILARHPTKILEVGFGTGMIIKSIGKQTLHYYAIDPSKQAYEYVKNNITQNDRDLAHIQLECCTADKFEVENAGIFDCAIINSVVQYFPSIQYLEQLLDKLLEKITGPGFIFIGDVKNFMQMNLFHGAIALHQAIQKTKLSEIKRKLYHLESTDSELYIHPCFFYKLQEKYPSISCVEVFHKHGVSPNEMNLFRYDVILSIGKKPLFEVTNFIEWSDLPEKNENLINTIIAPGMDHLMIKHIPNIRLAPYLEQFKLLKQLSSHATYRELLEQCVYDTNDMLSPIDLINLGKAHNMRVELVWHDVNEIACCDAIFIDHKYDNNFSLLYPTTTSNISDSNIPLENKFLFSLTIDLKCYLETKLPAYMIPSHFFVIREIPKTINGKIDYQSLPLPGEERPILSSSYLPPTTETEKKIADIFSTLLKVEQVGVADSFFELGGHSLLAIQLIFKLKEVFQREIPLQLIMQSSTVSNIAKIIDNRINYLSDEIMPSIDLNLELSTEQKQLDEALSNVNRDMAYVKNFSPKNILLTGASGFIGAFLLHSLIKQKIDKIYCIVREKNEDRAKNKLIDNMKYYHLWENSYESQIVALPGDLALERFNLPIDKYNYLENIVDLVIHNAAIVNFIIPYTDLKKANVIGARQIIEFASQYKVKPIHYISSLYVFTNEDFEKNGDITEACQPLYGNSLSLGYLQSKWVAEKLMLHARSLGVPISIYRLGRISGDTINFITQSDDFLWRLTRLGIHLGRLPALDFNIDILPVDCAAEAIVSAAMNHSHCNLTYHLRNTKTMKFTHFIDLLNKLHYNVEKISPSSWSTLLLDETYSMLLDAQDKSLLPLLTSNTLGSHNDIVFSCENTINQLRLNFPSVNQSLLTGYLAYFDKINYFTRN